MGLTSSKPEEVKAEQPPALVPPAQLTASLVVRGPYMTGKSALVSRLAPDKNDSSIEHFNPTIGLNFRKWEDKENNAVLQICDTSGAERYNSLMPMAISKADLVILTVDSSSNWETQMEYFSGMDEQLKNFCPNAVRLLVITQTDKERHETVTEQKIEEFKQALQISEHRECSALKDIGITQINTWIVEQVPVIANRKKQELEAEQALRQQEQFQAAQKTRYKSSIEERFTAVIDEITSGAVYADSKTQASADAILLQLEKLQADTLAKIDSGLYQENDKQADGIAKAVETFAEKVANKSLQDSDIKNFRAAMRPYTRCCSIVSMIVGAIVGFAIGVLVGAMAGSVSGPGAAVAALFGGGQGAIEGAAIAGVVMAGAGYAGAGMLPNQSNQMINQIEQQARNILGASDG